MTVIEIRDGTQVIEPFSDRILGRFAAESVMHPKTGMTIVGVNQLIGPEQVDAILLAGVDKVNVRSVLTCKTEHGVCAKCYGANLATGEPVNIGEAVGIIAAQSIGEPGTQLTMRTFHTGGIAGDDITQGLPRVEELFEARKPKGLAIIAEASGVVHINEKNKKREIVTIGNDGETKNYPIPYGSRLRVQNGQRVEAGDELTEGSVNPHDILKIKGTKGVQAYLTQEVQKVYRFQGVDINDRHIEVIIRQMLRKVRIEESGDTNMLPGSLVDIFQFERDNDAIVNQGGQPAVAKRVLLGITKASLATESFLSAASFQETTKVLTDASVKGKIDPLVGLKENVIIGKLIPAGTGMSRYNNIAIYMGEEEMNGDMADSRIESENSVPSPLSVEG
jgi:DNA-directed RNA polymerase subunit beta'